MNVSRCRSLAILWLVGLVASVGPASVGAVASEIVWDGSEPPQGIYFYWYEPSFYTGFAPRTQNPERVHIRLSRGNQVRLTMVLGDAEIDAYLADLVERRKIYQELIDAKVIELTTNLEYERFARKLDGAAVAQTVQNRQTLGPTAYRHKTVEVMSTLNPGRVFPIKIPAERVAESWHEALAGTSAEDLASASGKLDAANTLLPGRLNLYELTQEQESALSRSVELARAGPATAPAFREQAVAFLDLASGGRYPVRDGYVEAVEFTAIYPAGTVESWVSYKGMRLPAFGVTGIWKLIPRTQGRGITGMVDYLSTNPGYGFITMLPYEHAGGITYNAFHNAGVRCALGSTPFLPKEWRSVPGERNPAKHYQNLWIISRGPTSHGCTRLASGHMTEMRQVLPASSEVLEGVLTFRNLPQCYDVFDIDADGAPELMGVQYYLAFRSNDHTPVQAYVLNRRAPFYQWLYGSNIELGEVGESVIKEVVTCRYVGKKATEGQVYSSLRLYEAAYEPESIQFYKVKTVPFDTPRGFELNRELRKVGAGYALDRAKLLLP